jgi:DNA polymerase
VLRFKKTFFCTGKRRHLVPLMIAEYDPPAMDQSTRHRARLSLRSERALGLSSVRAARPRAAPTAAAMALRGSAPPARPPAAAVLEVLPARPALSTGQKLAQLGAMDENEVRGCIKCGLCKTRTQTVFGEGSPDARIFFIGEGPGETEDLTGRPFVGKAGHLLDKMIAAMGLRREQVYIANIVKCRPPGNRAPAPEETSSCTPYLERQLAIIRPEVIVTLGLPATRYMLQNNESMGRMRGQFHSWRGIKLMPTYHPAYVLRQYTEQTRAAVWSDLKQVMGLLDLRGPAGKSGAES